MARESARVRERGRERERERERGIRAAPGCRCFGVRGLGISFQITFNLQAWFQESYYT